MTTDENQKDHTSYNENGSYICTFLRLAYRQPKNQQVTKNEKNKKHIDSANFWSVNSTSNFLWR